MLLFIYQILADVFLRSGHHKKASQIFYNLSKIYNKWKIKASKVVQRAIQIPSRKSSLAATVARIHEAELHPLDFGADDYIWVKLAYATCLMRLG